VEVLKILAEMDKEKILLLILLAMVVTGLLVVRIVKGSKRRGIIEGLGLLGSESTQSTGQVQQEFLKLVMEGFAHKLNGSVAPLLLTLARLETNVSRIDVLGVETKIAISENNVRLDSYERAMDRNHAELVSVLRMVVERLDRVVENGRKRQG
jgi:hypothetical protein